jgi:RNA polymerase primary sigma factor
MRLPNYLHDKIQQIRQAEDYYLSRGIVKPDDRQIADRLGWEEKEVLKVRKAIQSPTSIDASRSDSGEGSGTMHQHFPDKSSHDPEKMVSTESERRFIRSLLEEDLKVEGGLNKKERIILKLRFGINSEKETIYLRAKSSAGNVDLRELNIEYDGQFRTLEDIGSLFGTTRERIRQIEMNALKKFRKLYYNKVIKNIHPSQITTEELEIIKSIHHKKRSPVSFDSAGVFKALRSKHLG